MKVLLVEDDPVHRLILKKIFEKSRHEVCTATNGIEALQLLSEATNFEVILTDIQMPKMNGLELLKRVKSNLKFKNIPVIGITSGEVNYYKSVSSILFDVLVSKPIDFRDLYILAKSKVSGAIN